VNASNGKTIWRQRNSGSEAAPTVVVNAAGQARVYAVDRLGNVQAMDAGTGALLWKSKPLEHTTAALSSDGKVLYGADYGGSVVALSPGNGAVIWKKILPYSQNYANIAVANGRLFIMSLKKVAFSLNARNGALVWKTNTLGATFGHPAVANGHVYTESLDGTFWNLSATTGAVEWSKKVWRGIGGPVVVGNRVYFTDMVKLGKPGRVLGFNTATMKQEFSWPDGKYSPVVPAGDSLVVVGYHTMYVLHPN
jgi:outer membrane protein assembly factor BamB